MLGNFDPVLLSRIQFAFTLSFHIIFPAFTIGLASWLAMLEWRWLRTGNTVYAEVYRMWVKIFAVTFGMGVVSGVVMSFQFGTNWSVFADRAGNVLGPLLGYEVLTAFFLEASFLGVMLFGWNRVGPRLHFAATVIVALGTLISAFWILSANSWMQTPQGFRIAENGLLYPTDWFQVVFNPSFPYRFAHMVTAAYLTTAFVAGGIGAFYLWRGSHTAQARVMLGMAMIMAVFVAPAQLVVGDQHGHVGAGLGKANEVPEAIRKGTEQAKKCLFKVPLDKGTIPHEVLGCFGAGRVLLKPASAGTGVIAGGAVRAIVEVAGIQDVLTKCIGTSNPHNVIHATVAALRELRSGAETAKMRGKTLEEITT